MCKSKLANSQPAQAVIGAAVQLPPDLYGQASAYADTHCISLTEALRYLIEAGLAAEARAMFEARICS